MKKKCETHVSQEVATTKYSQAIPGRIFVIRLEDGDTVHETIESFARKHAIGAATLVIPGGADKGSRLVVGPEDDGHFRDGKQ